MPQSDPMVATLLDWMEIFMHNSMRNFMLYAREKNLSMPQIGALFRIKHKGASGVSDIGSELGITSAGASQMLDRLVQLGLIVRTEDPNDRRGKQIALTEKGQAIVKESIRARQGWTESLAATLTEREKAQVAAALNILIEKTRQLETDSASTLNSMKE
jgi:DNA-binding MarR family transcriptional regulator